MSTYAVITQSNPPRYLNVRSPYSQTFVREARTLNGTWDRVSRVWVFDTRGGVTLDMVKRVCARHYDEVTVAQEGQSTVMQPSAGHVGVLKARITALVQVERVFDRNGGEYGPTRMHVMRDTAGHVFVWYASSERLNVGERVTLTGTVKRHDTFRGVAQTVLTRCKVQAKHGAEPVAPIDPSLTAPADEVPEFIVPEESGEVEEAPFMPPTQLAWWEQPWSCGHNDPIYVDGHTQRCACCHIERRDPTAPKTLAEEVGF